jgi:predicted phage terminase large subunit-like protein
LGPELTTDLSISEQELIQLLARPADALDALDRLDCEESLLNFVKRHWSLLEPGRELAIHWPLEAICEHLEAVTAGDIKRLLINVSPGFMKSLLCNVYWPAWEWGPKNKTSMRYVNFSYSASLTERDNRRFRDVMLSHDYGRLFGDRFALIKTGEQLISNDRTGWKLATSVGGVGTGERGDRVVLDDPHNVRDGESEGVRRSTVTWFREAMSNRLNDRDSAIVIIMQRVHEEDVSGVVISELSNEYHHLCIPYEWEGQRTISTVPHMRWNEDPRTQIGEEAWPARLPTKWRQFKITLGPYAVASQYQQQPSPRGGGIFKRDWWMLWGNPDDPDDARFKKFPKCEFMVASFDGAFGQKHENEYSALTIWGLFRDATTVIPDATFPRRVQAMQGRPKLMLMHAWKKRLPLQGRVPEQEFDESAEMYRRRAQPHWGIVEWVNDSCKRFGINVLLIEAKANGVDVANQLRLLTDRESYAIQLIDPGKLDKTGRAYAVQHLLADQMIYAPDRDWADDVITEMSQFPKGHDDYTDTATQAWKWLRDKGLAAHGHEIERDFAEELAYKPVAPSPLYPV